MFCTNCGMRQVIKAVQEPKPRCVECGHEIDKDTVFCTTCGVKQPKNTQPTIPVVKQTKTCVNCGAPLDDDSVFCTECGAKIKGETPSSHSDNSVEVLKKLKELRELELITEEEYIEKKKEVLNNLR